MLSIVASVFHKLGFGRRVRGDVFDFVRVHRRQSREHVAQVGERVDSSAAATPDDGVQDRAKLPGVGAPEKRPVLFVMPVGRMAFSTVSVMRSTV